MGELVLALLIFVRDIERPGEVLPVVVDGTELQTPSVRKQGVHSHGVVRTRELVPFRAAQQEVRQAEVLHDVLEDDKIFLNLALRVRLVHVTGVRFEEMYLADADEGPGLLRLITECVDQLVSFKRQVGVRADPEGEYRVHGRLAGGA